MRNDNKLVVTVLGVVCLILLTIGGSYAYFTANLTGGEEETTISVTGGTMNIIYNGGPNINVSNVIPDNNPAATKTFTVTGNNTTDLDMAYTVSLVVEDNTFSNEAIKYRLTSTNTSGNGTIVPGINDLTDIPTGPGTYELGRGMFTGPTDGDKIHTYNIQIYFPEADYNQNIDQDKSISLYITIVNAT